MKALGVICGIGSMLIGARTAGFKIMGNIEWRKYYHAVDEKNRNTFLENFKNAFMVESIDRLTDKQIHSLKNVDLIMGHTECGAYSALNQVQKGFRDRKNDKADLPLFVHLVRTFEPRFFVMDNLPQSLIGFPMEEWLAAFPDYDLFPEWVSNYHYGNVQLNRRRFFMIGAKREEKFRFVPGENEKTTTVEDCIGDLPIARNIPELNHVHVDPKADSFWPTLTDNGEKTRTFGDLAKYLMSLRTGQNGCYQNRQGEIKIKVGRYRTYWDKHGHVLTGGGFGAKNWVTHGCFHPKTGYPLTIRERARIQGCPDDFLFYGPPEVLIRQTGKFMPVQFCTFVARQIAAHIKKKRFVSTGKRIVKNSPFVDEARIKVCEDPKRRRKEFCEFCGVVSFCPWKTGKSWTNSKRPLEPSPCHQDPRSSIGTDELISSPKPGKKVGIPEETTRTEGKEPQNLAKPPQALSKQRSRSRLVTPLEKPPKTSKKATKAVNRGDVRTFEVKIRNERPKDYHCDCSYCRGNYLGELYDVENDTYYSNRLRGKYYVAKDKHLCPGQWVGYRFAVQRFTKPGDNVFDPTVGSGTAIVEAINNGRNGAGIELEFFKVAEENVDHAHEEEPGKKMTAVLIKGNVANVLGSKKKKSLSLYDLVMNGPPYPSLNGVTSDSPPRELNPGDREVLKNYEDPKNFGRLKGEPYFEAICKMYRDCVYLMTDGGKLVLLIKDLTRNKKPYLLHKMIVDRLLASEPRLRYFGSFIHKHWPSTCFIHTYRKRFPDVRLPVYQTGIVLEKISEPKKRRTS